jgi:predicted lipid-binding transport protein (Tim44 family)
MATSKWLQIAFILSVLAPAGASGQPYFYPSKGQDPSLQMRDRSECGSWATQQTGVNPAAPPSSPQPKASPLRGAAGGALIGLAAGSIGGEAGAGAAIGAVTGGLLGGVRRSNQTEQINAQRQQSIDAYNRALGACMLGRGYTVN